MKNECVQMHKGVFWLCVRVHPTLMLYQGSPLSLITQDSFEPWGKAKLMPEHKKCTSVRTACLTHKNVLVCSEGELFKRIN